MECTNSTSDWSEPFNVDNFAGGCSEPPMQEALDLQQGCTLYKPYKPSQVTFALYPDQLGPHHKNGLTCEACRQRKVKCDKSSPCTSCQRLGLVCVPVERARLPRGRTRKPERIVGSDKELSERVARLEKLLKKVANEREDELLIASTVPVPTYSYTQQQSAAESSNASPPNIRQDQNDNLPATGQPHLPRPSTAYVGGPFWEDIMQQVSLLNSRFVDMI